MGRAERVFTKRLGRKSEREESDLSGPEGMQCGGTAALWGGLVLERDKRSSQRRWNFRHYYRWELFGLRNDYFEITPNSIGESALRFPIEKGDIILAGRHYGKAKAFDYIVRAGGDFVMGLKHKAANYFDTENSAADSQESS